MCCFLGIYMQQFTAIDELLWVDSCQCYVEQRNWWHKQQMCCHCALAMKSCKVCNLGAKGLFIIESLLPRLPSGHYLSISFNPRKCHNSDAKALASGSPRCVRRMTGSGNIKGFVGQQVEWRWCWQLAVLLGNCDLFMGNLYEWKNNQDGKIGRN